MALILKTVGRKCRLQRGGAGQCSCKRGQSRTSRRQAQVNARAQQQTGRRKAHAINAGVKPPRSITSAPGEYSGTHDRKRRQCVQRFAGTRPAIADRSRRVGAVPGRRRAGGRRAYSVGGARRATSSSRRRLRGQIVVTRRAISGSAPA